MYNVTVTEFETLQMRCMNNGCCASIRAKRKYRQSHIIGAVLSLCVFCAWNVVYWIYLHDKEKIFMVYISLTPIMLVLLTHNLIWCTLSVMYCWKKDIPMVIENAQTHKLKELWPDVMLNTKHWTSSVLWRQEVTLFHEPEVIRFLLVVTPDPVKAFGGRSLYCLEHKEHKACARCRDIDQLLHTLGYECKNDALCQLKHSSSFTGSSISNSSESRGHTCWGNQLIDSSEEQTELVLRVKTPGSPCNEWSNCKDTTVFPLSTITKEVIRRNLYPNVAYGSLRLPLPPLLIRDLLLGYEVMDVGDDKVLRYLLPLVQKEKAMKSKVDSTAADNCGYIDESQV